MFNKCKASLAGSGLSADMASHSRGLVEARSCFADAADRLEILHELRCFHTQLLHLDGLAQLGPAEAMGPDLHHALGRSQETEQLKWEHNPFQEKLLGPKATHDHHPIAAVAIATGELRQGTACRIEAL